MAIFIIYFLINKFNLSFFHYSLREASLIIITNNAKLYRGGVGDLFDLTDVHPIVLQYLNVMLIKCYDYFLQRSSFFS